MTPSDVTEKSGQIRNARSRPILRLAVIWGLAALCILLFLSLNMKAGWEFTLMFRGKKLLTLLLVAYTVGIASVLFQTITHNRILTPSIMGFDALYVLLQSGLIFLFGGITYTQLSPYIKWTGETLIMVGALCLLYQWLFRLKGQNLHLLVLVGVILGTLFRSLSSLIQRMLDPSEFTLFQDAIFASFNSVDGYLLTLSLMVVVISSLLLFRYHSLFDVLMLGKDNAINLGVPYQRSVLATLALIAVLTALSTTLVGPVLFLGLLVANLSYTLAGSAQHKYLFPMVAGIGVVCLVGGETILQHVLQFESRLSIIIDFVGGLFFLALILRKQLK
ncbi:enterobactin ABC transporter permease [Corallincola luteus]|uniref:Enterobactin ABC transporter permease n=1 Tax=Corallincola luteus TaxID=1775177 RepID=A0ABY2AQ97_9GAMM|nr:iron chelate uptake ABC transporter family permease subunit [Corallincola luteus]TCI03706.1 enterobactin ABC transporter permease [Corallincola luteus]